MPKIQEILIKVEGELRIRHYSPDTVKSYLEALTDFFNFAPPDLGKIDIKLVKKFIVEQQAKGITPQTAKNYLDAINFFLKEVAGQPHLVKSLSGSFDKSKEFNRAGKIDITKNSKKPPTTLTHCEILKMIDSLENKKHALIISIGYGSGLKVSETVNLKVGDIDFDEGVVRVRGNNKERITVLPEKLKVELKEFLKGLGEDEYVFRSFRDGSKLSTRTLQDVVDKAGEEAGVEKEIGFQTLRNSFAVHLLENETSIIQVQKLLGHKSIKSTQMYAHVIKPKIEKIKSPLDFEEECVN